MVRPSPDEGAPAPGIIAAATMAILSVLIVGLVARASGQGGPGGRV